MALVLNNNIISSNKAQNNNEIFLPNYKNIDNIFSSENLTSKNNNVFSLEAKNNDLTFKELQEEYKTYIEKNQLFYTEKPLNIKFPNGLDSFGQSYQPNKKDIEKIENLIKIWENLNKDSKNFVKTKEAKEFFATLMPLFLVSDNNDNIEFNFKNLTSEIRIKLIEIMKNIHATKLLPHYGHLRSVAFYINKYNTKKGDDIIATNAPFYVSFPTNKNNLTQQEKEENNLYVDFVKKLCNTKISSNKKKIITLPYNVKEGQIYVGHALYSQFHIDKDGKIEKIIVNNSNDENGVNEFLFYFLPFIRELKKSDQLSKDLHQIIDNFEIEYTKTVNLLNTLGKSSNEYKVQYKNLNNLLNKIEKQFVQVDQIKPQSGPWCLKYAERINYINLYALQKGISVNEALKEEQFSDIRKRIEQKKTNFYNQKSSLSLNNNNAFDNVVYNNALHVKKEEYKNNNSIQNSKDVNGFNINFIGENDIPISKKQILNA